MYMYIIFIILWISNILHHFINIAYILNYWHNSIKKILNHVFIFKYLDCYCYNEMAKIPKSDQSQTKSRNYKSEKERNELTQTPGYTGGRIRCLGGVNIPCQPVTYTLSPVPWLWMQSQSHYDFIDNYGTPDLKL
jgi:hypothetical protein